MATDPKALAAAKLSARRARVRRIRRMVLAGAVTVFVAVWGVIFAALVTGHDPVLAAKAQTSAANASAGSTASSSPSASTGSSASTASSASGTSSVTTRQS